MSDKDTWRVRDGAREWRDVTFDIPRGELLTLRVAAIIQLDGLPLLSAAQTSI